jgi:hypothetical protein
MTNGTDPTRASGPLSLRTGTIGRATYLLSGSILLAIKFGVDRTVASIFRHEWSPVDYIAPGASLAMLIANPRERLFYTTLALGALPFITIGVWLTVLRLRSVGLSTAWAILFFVPVVNFAFFAVLCALPERIAKAVAVPKEPDATARPADTPAALAYSRIPDPPLSALDRLLPLNRAALNAVAMFLPAFIALGATVLSVQFLRDYGWGVFVGVPFCVGLMSSMLFAARGNPGLGRCVGIACLSLTAYGALLIVCEFEGAVCILMSAPLAYPVAILGGCVGAAFGTRQDRLHDSRHVMSAMLLFLPALMGLEKLAAPRAQTFVVTTAIEVDAPPQRVWPNVIGFGQIPQPVEMPFRLGVAYPIRAEIQGHGPGALRRCVFSTGAFVEPITDWNEPRLLKFSVTSNPPPLSEWSPYSHIHPPHLDHFLTSSGGQFELIELPGGRTRLTGTTWYQHHMFPATYWRLWSDWIIHRIHLRVLNHVKTLSEPGHIQR